MKSLFLEVTQNKLLFLCDLQEKVLHHFCERKFAHTNFSGKFGEIRAKPLCTPKNVPAPSPMTALMQLCCYGAQNRGLKKLQVTNFNLWQAMFTPLSKWHAPCLPYPRHATACGVKLLGRKFVA